MELEALVLFINGEEWQCHEFYDSYKGDGGIEIYHNKTFIGDIYGLWTPDPEDPEEMEKFKSKVVNFLDEKFLI